MSAKMVTVKELIPGDILYDTVISYNGKVLLNKDIELTPRHISLLINWDVQNIFIKTDEDLPAGQAAAEAISGTEVIDAEYQQYIQEYQGIATDINHGFGIIKRRNRIPVRYLQDTASNIQAFLANNKATAVNYLLANKCQTADAITQHSVTVASFAGIIARQLSWSETDIQGVALAGILHDVGELVSEKKDSRSHMAETAHLIKQTTGLSHEVILGIVQHREHLDGSGFPTGANSAKIHPYAKIIAVCDTFYDRSYIHEYADPFPALNILANDMFGKLDPFICHTFINRVRDSLLNNKVLLSDGQEAEIVYFHPNGSHLPVVRTAKGQIVDLSKAGDQMIHRVCAFSFAGQAAENSAGAM